jgi:predicted DNA-binding transcriptional regulator AlpA
MTWGDDMTDTTLWNIDEVAAYLRVPVLTIRWLRQEGRFAPAIKVGRRLVWDARDIAAWLETQREAEAA